MKRLFPSGVYRIGYMLFGKWLLPSWQSSLSRSIRSFWARRMVRYAGRNINIERGADFASDISIGDNSGLGVKCRIQGPCTIGNDIMMGPEVLIYTINHSHSDTGIPMRMQGNEKPREVAIEDDVWIGARAIILPGVTIAKGSIVGAGAVVSKSFPPYSVIVGNPAQAVRNRMDDQI